MKAVLKYGCRNALCQHKSTVLSVYEFKKIPIVPPDPRKQLGPIASKCAACRKPLRYIEVSEVCILVRDSAS